MNHKNRIKAIVLVTSAIIGTLWQISCAPKGLNEDKGPMVDVVMFQKKLNGNFRAASITNGHIYVVGQDSVHYSGDNGETWNEIEIKAKSPNGGDRDIDAAKIEKVVPSKNGAVFMSKEVIVAMNGKVGYGGWEIGEADDGLGNLGSCVPSAKFVGITVKGSTLIAARACQVLSGGLKITKLIGTGTPQKFEAVPPTAGGVFFISSIGICGEKTACVAAGTAEALLSFDLDVAQPNLSAIATRAGFGDPEKTSNKTGEWEATNDQVDAIGHVGEFYLVGLEYSHRNGQTGGLMVFKPGKKAKHFFSGQSVENFIKSSDGGVYAVTRNGLHYIGDNGQRDKSKDITKETIESRKNWIVPGFIEGRYRHMASYDIVFMFAYDQSQDGNHVIIIGKGFVLVGKKDKAPQDIISGN